MRGWPGRLVAVALLVLTLAACAGGGGNASSARSAPRPRGTLADDAEVLRGRRLFVDYCAACHGISGQGAVGPSFRGGKLLRDFETPDEQIDFVRSGKGVMPSFGTQLTDAELQAVVRYEREVLSALAP